MNNGQRINILIHKLLKQINRLSIGKYIVHSLTAIATVILLLIISTPTTMSQSLLSREQVEEMVIRQARAWENQDAKAIADDFAEDALFVAAGFRFEGQQGIEQAALDYFKDFHQTKVEIKRMIIEDNKGAVEWDWRDRNRKTNEEGFAEDAIVFELAEGKIVYWREYIEKKK